MSNLNNAITFNEWLKYKNYENIKKTNYLCGLGNATFPHVTLVDEPMKEFVYIPEGERVGMIKPLEALHKKHNSPQ
jgi:hypothetical protein